ncbi:MAG: ABC transporter permease [Canibacter sp.]
MSSATKIAAPRDRGVSAGEKIWLVARREITSRLQSKGFVVSMAVMIGLVVLAVLASGILPKFFADDEGSASDLTQVAVVDSDVAGMLPSDQFAAEQVGDAAAAEEAVRSGDVEAAVIENTDTPSGVEVIALEDAPSALVDALTLTPEVTLLDPLTDNPFIAYMLAIAFGVIFMWGGLTFGTMIAQSVVEEKSTRIVEILLATVRPRELMAGKVLGNSILAIGVIILIVGLSVVSMLVTGQELLFGEVGMSLLWFAILFLAGFVLLATLYASIAALVSRQEDIGSVTSPLMMLVMIPYFLVIFFNTNATVLAVMSYVPFSAPVGMPMRVYLGTAQWWEPIVSLAILVVTIVIVLLLGARIYENSILRTGARVKFGDAIKSS